MKSKSILALGLFPLALAINEPKNQCSNFLTVRIIQKNPNSRWRRAPMQSGFDDGSGFGDDFNTDSPVVVTDLTTRTENPSTTNPTGVPTDSTAAPTTNPTDAPTTNQKTTQQANEYTTTAVPAGKATIVMLDATGSMQNIGGRGRGRDLVVRKMEQFRQMLNEKVDNDKVNNQDLFFVTFNERATMTSYGSIDDWPKITRANYNPGYQTNLFDTMGCVLSDFNARFPDTEASVYLISDGVHALNAKKKGREAYQDYEVKDMVEELRENGWHFNFFGATDEDGKNELKSQANDLGFRRAEMKVFNFNGRQFGELLKSLLKTMVKNDKMDKEPEDTEQIPECEKCQKGRAGKMCRRRRKNQISAGLCIKA